MIIPETAAAYPAITGVGVYIPDQVLTNRQLIDKLGIVSTPEWIEERTGIRERRWAEPGWHASDMAEVAARAALHMAGVEPESISTLLVSTGSQDYPTPSVASLVHGRLGLPWECLTLDTKAACAGFIANLELASGRMQTNPGSTALVVGTELCSTRINPTDRRTVILFGDGAGAITMQPVTGANRPVSAMATEPDLTAVYVPAGGTRQAVKGPDDLAGKLVMDGPAVKKHAVSIMAGATREVAYRAGLSESRSPDAPIDWSDTILVPHQANARLIEAVGEELGVPEDRCVISVGEYGNTSSASIPMALAYAHEKKMLGGGRQRVMFTAVGAGMVGGSVLIDVALPVL